MHIILLRDYPTDKNPAANGFVHARVKAYIKSGLQVNVFVLNNADKPYTYIFDDVKVYVGDKTYFSKLYSLEKPLFVCVHFLDSIIIDCLETNNDMIKKVVIFVHGYEALFWYQRIFSGTFSNIRALYNFVNYIKCNSKELPKIRMFLKNTSLNCDFIAVSEWMKCQAERAWKCQGELKWHIIPNFINANLFTYKTRKVEESKKLLCIRSFSSGKYANDLTAKIIRKLSTNSIFNSLSFTWVGKGILYNKITKKIVKYKNVKLENRFMTHSEIKEYHKNHGIFICPTRQDAQGVSMCEAMSSGLVPVTLYNTAIPEFLPDVPDLICYNVNDMTSLVVKLVSDYDFYLKMSKLCSEFIQEKCSYNNTILKEIDLLESENI